MFEGGWEKGCLVAATVLAIAAFGIWIWAAHELSK